MEHGLVLAMIMGSGAMTTIGLLNPESGQGKSFLALGGAGILAIIAVVWVKRLLTASTKAPDRRSES
jgi:hypothetical protein